MFDALKAIGVKPSDLARLLKLNRVTVSLWYNGHAAPHTIHAAKVRKVVDLLQRAAEDGDLPVPGTVRRDERAQYMANAVVKQAVAAKSQQK